MCLCFQVEKAFKSLGSMTEAILQEAQDYIVVERKTLQDVKAMADNTTKAEIARLQSQNVLLNRALETERAKVERAKDDLVKRIIALFDVFTAERGRSLREMFSELTESNTSAETGMEKLGKDQGHRLEAVIGGGKEWSGTLDKRAGESKRLRDGGLKVKCTHGVICTLSYFFRRSVPPMRHSEITLLASKHLSWARSMVSLVICSGNYSSQTPRILKVRLALAGS